MTDANMFQTHWFGCWREHHDCAVAMVERAAELIGPTWFPSPADRDRKEQWVAMLNGPAAVFRADSDTPITQEEVRQWRDEAENPNA